MPVFSSTVDDPRDQDDPEEDGASDKDSSKGETGGVCRFEFLLLFVPSLQQRSPFMKKTPGDCELCSLELCLVLVADCIV